MRNKIRWSYSWHKFNYIPILFSMFYLQHILFFCDILLVSYFPFLFFPSANTMTLSWLSNNMSADYEDVHIPVKKTKPKQTKVVTF